MKKIKLQDIKWVIRLLNDLFDQNKLNFDDFSNLVDSIIFGDR